MSPFEEGQRAEAPQDGVELETKKEAPCGWVIKEGCENGEVNSTAVAMAGISAGKKEDFWVCEEQPGKKPTGSHVHRSQTQWGHPSDSNGPALPQCWDGAHPSFPNALGSSNLPEMVLQMQIHQTQWVHLKALHPELCQLGACSWI